MLQVIAGIAIGIAIRPFAETVIKTVKVMADNAREQVKKDQEAKDAEKKEETGDTQA